MNSTIQPINPSSIEGSGGILMRRNYQAQGLQRTVGIEQMFEKDLREATEQVIAAMRKNRMGMEAMYALMCQRGGIITVQIAPGLTPLPKPVGNGFRRR